MTLDDLMLDMYALEDEMRVFERKYGVLSETFFESYMSGEEPPNQAWSATGLLGQVPIRFGCVVVSSISLLFNPYVLRHEHLPM